MGLYRDGRVLSLVLFASLAALHTWPLVTAPAHLSRNDNADTILNEWTIAWVAHQVPRDPWHLFDANIFYPDRNTLAYSEHLFLPAMLGAPLLWLGASPVLTYNLLLLAGMTLTGWSMALLVRHWTGDWAAALISGTIVAFNAHTLTRLPHLQAQHAEFLPLALLSLDRLLVTPRLRTAVALGALFAAQALTSYYLLVFAALVLAVGVAVRPEDWWSARWPKLMLALLISALIAAALVIPFLIPYRKLQLTRPLAEVAFYSATWRNYLSSPARVHYGSWSFRWFGGSAALFPGIVATVLALIAIGGGTALADRRARMLAACGLVGLALSFGPAMPGYSLAYQMMPLLQGIRNAARFGYLVIVAIAVLAGFGLALVRTRWRRASWLPVATTGLFIAVNLDAFSAPIEYIAVQPIPHLYDRIRSRDAVITEFPFYPPDRIHLNAPYLLNATRHWKPILNGYSGLVPASYEAHYQALRTFPDDRAVAALRAEHVTHVVVHEDELRARVAADAVDRVRQSKELQLIEDEGGVALYALTTDR